MVVAGTVMVYVVSGITGWKMDSTDASAWHPSGMDVLTDHATGLQYLKAGDALTPRLDRDGKQMHEGE